MKPEWTVLLIGGSTGTGKSTLAGQIARLYDVPVLDGDDLRYAVEAAVTPGADPDLHIFREAGFWEQPVEENVTRTLRWAQRMCRICEPVMARRHFVQRPVIIEGVWLLPAFASQTEYDGIPMAGEVRSLFLGEDDRDALHARLRERDGDAGLPPDQPLRIDAFHEYGRLITASAHHHGSPVLDCRPFETLLERTLAALDAREAG